MKELFDLITNAGLGISSFIALLYFINKYLLVNKETMQLVSDTMGSFERNLSSLSDNMLKITSSQELIQENLTKLSERVDNIESVVLNEKSKKKTSS